MVDTLKNNPDMLPQKEVKVSNTNINIPKGTYEYKLKSIVSQLFPEGSNFKTVEKYQIIHDWECQYLNYNYEALSDIALVEQNNDPEYCLNTGKAVCGGYAELYKDLCNTAKLNCSFIDGYADIFGQKDFGHAWNAVEVDEKFYHIDVCWDDTTTTHTVYDWFLQGSGYITNNMRSWRQVIDFSVESYPIIRMNIEPYTFNITKS